MPSRLLKVLPSALVLSPSMKCAGCRFALQGETRVFSTPVFGECPLWVKSRHSRRMSALLPKADIKGCTLRSAYLSAEFPRTNFAAKGQLRQFCRLLLGR